MSVIWIKAERDTYRSQVLYALLRAEIAYAACTFAMLASLIEDLSDGRRLDPGLALSVAHAHLCKSWAD